MHAPSPHGPVYRKNQYCQFLVCSSGDISCLCKQTCFYYFYFSSFTQLVLCHNAVLLFSLSKNPSLWLHKVFPPFLKAIAYSIPQIYSNFIYLVNRILLVFLSNHSIHISLEGGNNLLISWSGDQLKKAGSNTHHTLESFSVQVLNLGRREDGELPPPNWLHQESQLASVHWSSG